MPWYSAAIRGTGDVFACCMLMIDETAKPLGNVRQESLESVWTGPGYQRIREEMERVTLCKTNMNPAKQDFEFLAPVCTQHYGCSLSCSLTAEDFFAAAERIHQAKRRSPRGILTQIKHGRPLRRNTNGPHLNGNGH
jgi:hypothetical protein